MWSLWWLPPPPISDILDLHQEDDDDDGTLLRQDGVGEWSGKWSVNKSTNIRTHGPHLQRPAKFLSQATHFALPKPPNFDQCAATLRNCPIATSQIQSKLSRKSWTFHESFHHLTFQKLNEVRDEWLRVNFWYAFDERGQKILNALFHATNTFVLTNPGKCLNVKWKT